MPMVSIRGLKTDIMKETRRLDKLIARRNEIDAAIIRTESHIKAISDEVKWLEEEYEKNQHLYKKQSGLT